MIAKVLIGALIFIQVLADPANPLWPVTFNEQFVQSYANAPLVRVSGKFFYDTVRDITRIDRSNGIHDPICGSVLPGVNAPCTQLIRDKKRYVIHFERRTCCMCCDAAHGCGTLRRDWLSTAKFVGEEILQGQSFYKWSIKDGDQTDYYYDRKFDRVPRRFTSGQTTIQDWTMITYSTLHIADFIFALPDYCSSTCPATTKCGQFQFPVKQQ